MGRSYRILYGLHITAGNSTVRGLVISGFGARAGSTNGVGIVLENLGNNVVEGNYIGTNLTGQVAKGNLSYGVFMDGDNNRIGEKSIRQPPAMSSPGTWLPASA